MEYLIIKTNEDLSRWQIVRRAYNIKKAKEILKELKKLHSIEKFSIAKIVA